MSMVAAIALISQLTLNAPPVHPNVHFGLGEFKQAIEGFSKRVHARPGDRDSWKGLAMSHLHAGDYVRANEVAREGAANHPRDGYLRAMVGWTALNLGRINQAQSACRGALHLADGKAVGRICLGLSLVMLGDVRRALRYLEGSGSISRWPVSRYLIGLSRFHLGYTSGAQREYQVASNSGSKSLGQLVRHAARRDSVLRPIGEKPLYQALPPEEVHNVPVHAIGGAPFVHATVNKHPVFHAGLTVQTSVAVISKTLADTLCLKPMKTTVPARDAEGQIRQLPLVMLDVLNVGGYSIRNVPAVVDDFRKRYPPMFRKALFLPAHLIFANARVSLDPEKKTLTIARGDLPARDPTLLRIDGQIWVRHAKKWRQLQLGWAESTMVIPPIGMALTAPPLRLTASRGWTLDLTGLTFDLKGASSR